jgi:hypothetical protein
LWKTDSESWWWITSRQSLLTDVKSQQTMTILQSMFVIVDWWWKWSSEIHLFVDGGDLLNINNGGIQ